MNELSRPKDKIIIISFFFQNKNKNLKDAYLFLAHRQREMSLGVCWLWYPYSPEMPLLRSSPFAFVRSRRLFSATCSVSGNKRKNKEKVIVISGPTGAGKSRLALELAKRLNGEIISADSVQVKHRVLFPFFFYSFLFSVLFSLVLPSVWFFRKNGRGTVSCVINLGIYVIFIFHMFGFWESRDLSFLRMFYAFFFKKSVNLMFVKIATRGSWKYDNVGEKNIIETESSKLQEKLLERLNI